MESGEWRVSYSLTTPHYLYSPSTHAKILLKHVIVIFYIQEESNSVREA